MSRASVLLNPIEDLVSIEEHTALDLKVRDTPAKYQKPDGRFGGRQHVRDLHGIEELSGNFHVAHALPTLTAPQWENDWTEWERLGNTNES